MGSGREEALLTHPPLTSCCARPVPNRVGDPWCKLFYYEKKDLVCVHSRNRQTGVPFLVQSLTCWVAWGALQPSGAFFRSKMIDRLIDH